jgi:pimeloyl-ACP methyl ester carboxylesterase
MKGEYMARKGLLKRDVHTWEPPLEVPREECMKASQGVLAMPNIKLKQNEDVFPIRALEMDWDMGVMVYEPKDAAKIPAGADGKKVGIFLLHGGENDWRQMEKLALLLTEKFGYKVVSMTFPGRLYLEHPSRNWPGDTLNPDGTVRTPIWKKGELITPDQYDVIKDVKKRERYGTRILARAKPGTTFYYRMAAWPVAFEEGMKDACRRHFPAEEYSIFVQGHSTGGPIVFMLSQRVPNIAGVLAVENSPFGYINEQKHGWSGSLGKIGEYGRVTKRPKPRKDLFNELYIRSWRDTARYRGPEALGKEGPQALMRLPMLMEEVLEEWDQKKWSPRFKAEYTITHNIVGSLTEAAKVTAKRLNLGPKETEALVKRYRGYTRELSGVGVKPVPPVFFSISKDSRDHSPEVYKEVILPMFAAMRPPPKTHLVHFGAGVHSMWRPEEDLPLGIAPAVVKIWHDAFTNGYFVVK